ncbi:MAG: 1,4-dihydroxy-6-naphthoate synthase [Sphingobacteriales bacterium]|nr:1,4-dihydroxy-6-naphthoate synthase [Sphingobacteriales bacterium]
MKLTLGFSPCPNDTFIFDALVNQKIDTGDLEFEVVLDDVETLNQWALQGKLDITKLSFPAFFQSAPAYVLLDSGSALGKGVGPLLVRSASLRFPDINQCSIAIPGVHTTANLLLSFAYPDATYKKPMLFSAIEDAVLNGETELGVIIHENRFTYQEKGLVKLMDLGEYWEEKMKVPVPLGGIAARRTLGKETLQKVNGLIRKSLELARDTYPQVTGYVKEHAQTMSEQVMRQHIDLYVNNYSLDLGKEGKKSIRELYKVFNTLQVNPGEAVTGNRLFMEEPES